MTKIICKQCKKIMVENSEDCEDEEYLSCPYCENMIKNPYYKDG